MNDAFDFANVKSQEGDALEPSTGGKYLYPGMYMLSLVSVALGHSSVKNTPYMEVTLKAVSKNPAFNDKICKEKFFLSSKALSRVQYLYEVFFDKPLTNKFENAEQLVAHFDKLVNHEKVKLIKKPIVVGGQISADKTKVYSNLPFTGYLVNESRFEEGAFEINGDMFKRVITGDVREVDLEKASTNSDDDILPSSTPSDDVPF